MTGDEAWVPFYDFESNTEESKQYVEGEPAPKRRKVGWKSSGDNFFRALKQLGL